MFRPRIIPVLLASNGAAVKTKQFSDPVYLGDLVNTARIFSELKADELIVLDIDASKEGRSIAPELVKELSTETTMPLAVGGGIRSLHTIEHLLQAGAEKVILGTSAFETPDFVREAVAEFGSSTISVCMDVWKDENKFSVRYANGQQSSPLDLAPTVIHFEGLGVGEIIVQSINNDGMRSGYDLELFATTSAVSTIPIVALGGAATLNDFSDAYFDAGVSACAASALFVFHRSGVLISYPEKSQIRHLLNRS